MLSQSTISRSSAMLPRLVGRAASQVVSVAINSTSVAPAARSGQYVRSASTKACGKGHQEFVSLFDVMCEKKDRKISIKPVAAQTKVTGSAECIDGCHAAAHIAYGMCDNAFIYPITPSSPMAELADAWAAAGRKNAKGHVLDIVEMQAEGGAAGAVHGSLASGAMTTTFTASQGLLLMIPNMYKIAGELLPCVFHVAARALAGEALSIFGDHQDVMAARATGFALLSSHSVQESMDLALVSHLATLKSSVPFVHFFDGFRTSHEINKVNVIPYSTLTGLLQKPEYVQAQQAAHSRALNPLHPQLRGPSQGPDVYFQAVEAANPYYQKTPAIVQECMDEVAALTGRSYHLFDYVGHPKAERVIIMMGAGATVVEEVVKYMNETQNAKVGLVKVHLYRPWSPAHLLAAIPASAKKIAVLDRTKEAGSHYEPLALDVLSSIQDAAQHGVYAKRGGRVPMIVGGRWGLGSKEFTPIMAKAVFDNLASSSPRNHFSVGINDDVSGLSLPLNDPISTVPQGTVECLFWGLGSDGTVGANKDAIAIIGDNTKLYAQGYFNYDAHKSGGVTVSHLRFGPHPITSSYLVQEADYIGCHFTPYIHKYDVVGNLKKNGVFVLNTDSSVDETIATLPARVKRSLASKNARFFIIDARKIAESIGLGKHINMIMQTCFFALAKVMPFEESVALLKEAIRHTYKKKGDKIINMNIAACDKAVAGLVEIPVPAEWANATEQAETTSQAKLPEFVDKIMMPMQRLEGDALPVSAFTGDARGGIQPMGLTKHERRHIAARVPLWNADKCVQCNHCAMVCPHAAVRPFLQTQEAERAAIDSGKAPKSWKSIKATAELDGWWRFSIQVSPADCSGCGLCVAYCNDHALELRPLKENMVEQQARFDYAVTLPNYGHLLDKRTVQGVQFQQPLLEFSGACEGCGETPYIKLITQLFGHRLMIANATGCSSIWGGTYASNPYTVRPDGKGPAWGNSLFEDNAEYGLGMFKGNQLLRRKQAARAQKALSQQVPMSAELKKSLQEWVECFEDHSRIEDANKVSDRLQELLATEKDNHAALADLYAYRDSFAVPAQWIVGGDGWAYDIGYNGLDHVLASGEKVNILVMDTETYSNTGGQRSKATPLGAVCKFAAGGNRKTKKDLGAMAMSYGNVYVASIAMGADMTHTIRAMTEAENYPGTSIVIAYCPCQLHGSQLFNTALRDKMAVDSGYWSLYRYDPRLISQGKNPFQLDSKKLRGDLQKYLETDNRYLQLMRANPKIAKELNHQLKEMAQERFARLKRRSEESGDGASTASRLEDLDMIILYGSETGTAKSLAARLGGEAKLRGMQSLVCAMDDFDFEQLLTAGAIKCPITFLTSTCGSGKFPANAQEMYNFLCKQKAGALSHLKFSVFGLGSTNYVHYCKAAIDLEKKLIELGAQPVVQRGAGNEKDADKIETGWEDWEPMLWTALKAKAPAMPAGPAPAPYTVTLSAPAKTQPVVPVGAQPIRLTVNKRVMPQDYDRHVAHLEFDLRGQLNMNYKLGDCLAIFPKNEPQQVEEFLSFYGVDGDQVAKIAPVHGAAPKAGMPKQDMTVAQLFEDVLDVFGRPSRRFYRELALFATEASEKAALLDIAQDKTKYAAMVAESVTFADIFRQFPSAKPSLAHLVHMLPVIQPRYYSIASSRAMNPESLQLFIVDNEWKTPSGKTCKGQCTSYLARLAPKPNNGAVLVNCALRRSAIEVPQTQEAPVIMAGLGTGVASFRAFVQERVAAKRKGEKVGPMVLYYGTRYHQKDFMYLEEFSQYEKEGVVVVRPACDADGDASNPKFVNHLIAEDSARTHEMMFKQGGYFYYCGLSGVVPGIIREAVRSCLIKEGGLTQAQAEATMNDLVIKGKYNVEAW